MLCATHIFYGIKFEISRIYLIFWGFIGIWILWKFKIILEENLKRCWRKNEIHSSILSSRKLYYIPFCYPFMYPCFYKLIWPIIYTIKKWGLNLDFWLLIERTEVWLLNCTLSGCLPSICSSWISHSHDHYTFARLLGLIILKFTPLYNEL